MRLSGMILLATVAFAAACDDDRVIGPEEPPPGLMGHYTMSALLFDPQGSLPVVDLRTRLQGSLPQLVLARNGAAQLVFTDPASGLVTLADASYTVLRAGGVRVTFDDRSTLYRRVLLSKSMTFTFDQSTGSLTFSAASPEGVPRQRLIELVPELADEQLFDPVPGQLTVVFQPTLTTQ